MMNTTTARFAVGDVVDARLYGERGNEPWTAGWRVRSVEFEDYIVERNGVAACVGSARVRAPQM